MVCERLQMPLRISSKTNVILLDDVWGFLWIQQISTSEQANGRFSLGALRQIDSLKRTKAQGHLRGWVREIRIEFGFP